MRLGERSVSRHRPSIFSWPSVGKTLRERGLCLADSDDDGIVALP